MISSDLALSVSSHGRYNDIDLGVSINIGAEADLGEFRESQWQQPVHVHPVS